MGKCTGLMGTITKANGRMGFFTEKVTTMTNLG